MRTFTSETWPDYELIDSGDGMKFERFGMVYLIRSETVALWKPKSSLSEWRKRAHAEFQYTDKGKGTWERYKTFPDKWTVRFPLGKTEIGLELHLTRFKHIGIFPEQSSNWQYIFDNVKAGDKVLNLFAYTGGATLAARAAGASVTHVDSIKQVIQWGKRNMEVSGLSDIRWILEDAQKFIQREGRRGNVYDMIIMDPPSYGLGTKGEKWKLEDKLNDFIKEANLISTAKTKWIVNTYSGLSPLMLENVLAAHLPKATIDCREIVLTSEKSWSLPLGTVSRVG